MKIAYVITAHKDASQLRRLLNSIYWPGNTYVIHIDSKAPPEVHEIAKEFASTHALSAVIPSDKIIWGSWRLARVQILGLERALTLSNDWGYVLNLTGQDYPLKAQPELAAILEQGDTTKSYMEVLPFKNASADPKKRLEHWWLPWRGKMHKFWRRTWPSFEVYWGSNQWAFTRQAAEFVARSEVSKHMQRTFRFSLCADELIFQNIMMHGPMRDTIIAEPMRKIIWNGGWHPKVFTLADREELLGAKEWFGRKFDQAVDSQIMDLIDKELQSRTKQYSQASEAAA
jgi:hypothetical protein